MAARPGRIIDDSVVPFPRPRTVEMSYEPDFVALTQRLREMIVHAQPPKESHAMNAQLQRRIASAALIIGFFVMWEVICLAFGIRDIVLPRPSQIIYTLVTRFPAIWPHAVQTLYTTLVGFALGIVFGVLLGVLVGSSRLAYDVGLSAADRLFEHSQGRGGADLRAVVRRRHRAGGPDRDDPARVLSRSS